MLIKSGVIVAGMTMLSRVFGLARELFVAATFGSTSEADCVNVAFKLPNLFRRIFGEGALSAVFVPIFNQKLAISRDQARVFAGGTSAVLFLTLVGIVLLMQILMPYLMYLIAPGFIHNPEKYSLAILLCRLTIPYLILISFVALIGGMLSSIGQFGAFAASPIILNIVVICFTYSTQNFIQPEFAISYALLIAGVLQFLFVFYYLLKAQLTFSCRIPREDYHKNDIKKLLSKMLPASISSGAQQLNIFISQSIASFLPGAVSILSYADRLYQLPLSLIGISFATILLPELSKLYKLDNFDRANSLQNRAISLASFVAIPAMLGLFILAEPIIWVIYQRGEFSEADTFAVSSALSAFSVGLPAYVLNKVLSPIFYANSDTKTPLKITLITITINTILNLLLIWEFKYVGIAIGSSIAAWVNVFLLVKYSRRYGNFVIKKQTYINCLKSLFSSIIMGIFLIWNKSTLLQCLVVYSFSMKMLILLGFIFFAILIYVISAVLFGLRKSAFINL